MLKPTLLAAGALLASAVPALADYYIVHGPDRHCRVVERYVPGEDRDFVRVGPPRLNTYDEAERQLNVVCRDHGYYRMGREALLGRDRY